MGNEDKDGQKIVGTITIHLPARTNRFAAGWLAKLIAHGTRLASECSHRSPAYNPTPARELQKAPILRASEGTAASTGAARRSPLTEHRATPLLNDTGSGTMAQAEEVRGGRVFWKIALTRLTSHSHYSIF